MELAWTTAPAGALAELSEDQVGGLLLRRRLLALRGRLLIPPSSLAGAGVRGRILRRMAFKFRGAAIGLGRGRSYCLVRRHTRNVRGGMGRQEDCNNFCW